MRRRGTRRLVPALGFTAVVSAVMGLAPSAPAHAAGGEVVLYGDSASGVNQTGAFFEYFVSHHSPVQVVNNAFAGTGPCQWLPQMAQDASSGNVSVAVLAFSGDAFGCESHPLESASYYGAYQSEVTQAAELFSQAGAHTFLIGMPMPWSAVEAQDPNWDRLNEIYAGIAAAVPNTTFVNAASAVEANGDFAWTLPCLSFETYCGPGGQNPVRARDGGHFCPLDPNAATCADYSSGGVRFAMAEANAVNQFLATGSAPPYEGPPLPPSGTPPRLAPGQRDPYFLARDTMQPGQSLQAGQSLRSLDGRYTAILQADGNFVCYGPSGPVWSTGTAGTRAWELALQPDGSLVLDGPPGVVWSSPTSGDGPFELVLSNDGQLGVYGVTSEVWSSPMPPPAPSPSLTASQLHHASRSPGTGTARSSGTAKKGARG